jgi:hypothetical protein
MKGITIVQVSSIQHYNNLSFYPNNLKVVIFFLCGIANGNPLSEADAQYHRAPAPAYGGSDCKTVYEEVCSTSHEQQCSSKYQDVCVTLHEQQCSPYTEQQCIDIEQQQCRETE